MKYSYEQIKDIIETDYNEVYSTKLIHKGGRGMRTFYVSFSRALEELHRAVGPFVVNLDQFKEYILHLKESVKPDIYEIILDYCRDKLKIDFRKEQK